MDRRPDEKYPPIEPHDHGMLDVGDGNLVYWEVCGNPPASPLSSSTAARGRGAGPAWELARAWPDAELTVIDDAGHTGGPATSRAVLAALDDFARRA
jgi:hypothetical protein